MATGDPSPGRPAPPTTEVRDRRLGTALVVAQFGALGLALLPVGPVLGAGQLRPVGVGCLAAAGVVGGLGLAAMGADTRVHPVPGEHTQLHTSGIYAVIRHPMYAAVGLAGLGVALVTGRVLAMASFAGLLGVLHAKAGMEDRLLLQRHGPGYAAYAAQVPGIIPRPWRRPRAAGSPPAPGPR